jgi:hypothetical protein
LGCSGPQTFRAWASLQSKATHNWDSRRRSTQQHAPQDELTGQLNQTLDPERNQIHDFEAQKIMILVKRIEYLLYQ